MKAEQRKELETNALADRMGHMVRRVKTQPRRATLYYVIAGAVLLVVLFLVVRYFVRERESESRRWMIVDIGQPSLFKQIREDGQTNAAKTVQFQVAWFYYWEYGIKRLGVGNPAQAMLALDEAAKLYDVLAKDCEADPVWEPEALYGLAAIEETRAVKGADHLESAKTRYEELAKKYPSSARGLVAGEWVKNYENPTKRKELTEFYDEIRSRLRLEVELPHKGLDLQKFLKKKLQEAK